jgi:phytoene synthase
VDLDKDRIYLPEVDLKSNNVTIEQLFDKKTDDNFKNLMKTLIERTEYIFAKGKELIIRTNNDMKLKKLKKELKLTWLGGNLILSKIKGIDYDVLNHRPEINMKNKLNLIFKTFFQLNIG